jgi:hypothetical protein
VSPCFLPRIPSPPPSVSPAIPTNGQVPAERARPCSSSEADTRPSRVLAPTVATPPETDTAAIGDTSITNARLTERPAKQWPPLGQADGIGPGTSSPHRHFDHALDLPIDESLLYRTRTAARAACPRPPPPCPVPASHSLTFSTASLSSMRFPAMRSVQAYTRDALQLHRPDLGEGHVDPS